MRSALCVKRRARQLNRLNRRRPRRRPARRRCPRSPLGSSLAHPVLGRPALAGTGRPLSPFTADAQPTPDAQPRWQTALRHQWHPLAARGQGQRRPRPGPSVAWGQQRPHPQGPADSRRCPFIYSRAHPLPPPVCASQAGRHCNESGEEGGGYRRLGGLGRLGRRRIQA